MTEVVTVVQARMASQRLPGKVLAPLAGMPTLALLVHRLRRTRTRHRLIIATTDRPEDAAVADLAHALDAPVVRGPVDDVMSRFRLALAALEGPPARLVVRATADNPLTDPDLFDFTIDRITADGADYAYPRQVPVGTAVDVFTMAAFAACDAEGRTPRAREHINAHILDHPERFIAIDPPPPPRQRRPDIRVTIDTPADAARAQRLLEGVADPVQLSLDALIERHDRIFHDG